jgi:hypothetical protein
MGDELKEYREQVEKIKADADEMQEKINSIADETVAFWNNTVKPQVTKWAPDVCQSISDWIPKIAEAEGISSGAALAIIVIIMEKAVHDIKAELYEVGEDGNGDKE